MTYAFDPELAPWVAMLPKTDLTDIAATRAQVAEMLAQLPKPPVPDTLSIEDTTTNGVPVRIYRPTGRPGPLPALLNLHGGGFVFGDLEFAHAESVRIATEVEAVVVSVDYRLAPEHPFPAGLEDCYTALGWTVDNAGDLGIDPARVGVGGESAGGGLAASVAQLARARGGPALRFQYLGIPELDDSLETVSMRTFVDTPLWNRPAAEISWKSYLTGETTLDGVPAAPARAEDLSGLPPAFVSTSEFDPLRDEGLAYAQRLLQAGVSVELHHYPGTFHGSVMVADAAVTRRMIRDAIEALRRSL
ncbi:MAG TPA: alpha/beta hydrolase [Amycolatopsis sp.]|uniref:alpha/beta hydrolase n=1 Tax=Amycolatopsis sp. TaxID=37632 RepID=UPI002B470B55|nr:alpha/beta hydrolase [Amycolatopsis sp.]HKS44570.1 alpha/beta hydrolase [Amycolatopsis sp.]